MARRIVLGLIMAGLGAPIPAAEPAELAESFQVEDAAQPIRVLVLTATHGYRHAPAIDAARRLFEALAETTEFRFTFSEDVDDLDAGILARYQVLVLANSTLRTAVPSDDPRAGGWRGNRLERPVTAVHAEAILSFAAAGGGIVAAHSALDALYGLESYRALLGGGLFVSHPWTQAVRIRNEAPDHPTMAHLGGTFELTDEIYVLDENPRPNVIVLASLDMASVDAARLEGRTAPGDEARRDFPISWVRRHGDGRVFVTKLGHFPEVWTDPAFVQHLLQGMRVAAGRLPLD